MLFANYAQKEPIHKNSLEIVQIALQEHSLIKVQPYAQNAQKEHFQIQPLLHALHVNQELILSRAHQLVPNARPVHFPELGQVSVLNVQKDFIQPEKLQIVLNVQVVITILKKEPHHVRYAPKVLILLLILQLVIFVQQVHIQKMALLLALPAQQVLFLLNILMNVINVPLEHILGQDLLPVQNVLLVHMLIRRDKLLVIYVKKEHFLL